MTVCDMCQKPLASCVVFRYGVDPVKSMELCGDCNGELLSCVEDKILAMKNRAKPSKTDIERAVQQGFRPLMEGGR